jgi:YD repeat-containing protein
MNFFIKIATSFLLLLYSNLNAQITKDLPDYFPVSPNAASFAKQGLYPVDYSTGKINVSVPVYVIKTGGLIVPINLSYNTAGIQLDELASWVGLGWNLNAGGVIVRNVKGIPDNDIPIPNMSNFAFSSHNYARIFNQHQGEEDTANDEFIINAPGLSGSFYFVNGKALFRDFQNTNVKLLYKNNQNNGSNSYMEVTKDDGTIYRFGYSLNSISATEIVFNNPNFTKLSNYISTWYLTEIVSANGKDIISFKYNQVNNTTDYSITTGERMKDSEVFTTPVLESVFPSGNILSTSKQFLTSISFPNGLIEFVSSKTRKDLIEDNKLDKISIYATKGATKNLMQEYGFIYDYYLRSGGVSITAFPDTSSNPANAYNSTKNTSGRSKSLRLIQMTNNILNVKHTFEYESSILPCRGTTKKDYWGYINGNLGTLISPTNITKQVSSTNGIFQEANYLVGTGQRAANEKLMGSGILQKIIYPEGGYSIFEYETNRYSEYVTTITTESFSVNYTAFGFKCLYDKHNSVDATFTTGINYVEGSGRISIYFSHAKSRQNASQVQLNTTRWNSGGTYDNINQLWPDSSYSISNFNLGNGPFHVLISDTGTGGLGASDCTSSSFSASWEEKVGDVTTLTDKLVGGLRIKTIKNYDGVNNNPITIKRYQYDSPNVLIKEGNTGYNRRFFGNGNSGQALNPILVSASLFDNNLGGSPAITYGKVTEEEIDPVTLSTNGKTEYFFENIASERVLDQGALPVIYKNVNYVLPFNSIYTAATSIIDFGFYKNELWNYGSLIKKNIYRNIDSSHLKLIQSNENKYNVIKRELLPYNLIFNIFDTKRFPGDCPASFYTTPSYDTTYDCDSAQFFYFIGQTSLGKKVLTQTTTTEFDANEIPTLSTVTKYSYENPIHNQVTKTETTNSKNEIVKTQLSYPQDLLVVGQTDEMKKLVDQNRINKPIKTETFVNNVQISESITKYEVSTATGNLLLPKEIHSSKGIVETFPFNNANRKISFTLYDSDIVNGIVVGNGNVLEYLVERGTPVSVIWGYNKTQPIAKIENIPYMSIPSALITAVQMASDSGIEANLLTELNNLRNNPAFANTMVTTYTYSPLVGLSTITDPKGLTTSYEYDSFGRLLFVKDAQGNILSENQYHYKN